MAEKEEELGNTIGQIAQVEYRMRRLQGNIAEIERSLGVLREQLLELHKRRQQLCPHRRVVRADECPDRCDLWNYDSAGFGSLPPEVRMCEDCGLAGAADGWTDHVALFGKDVQARTVAEDEFQRLYDLLPHYRF